MVLWGLTIIRLHLAVYLCRLNGGSLETRQLQRCGLILINVIAKEHRQRQLMRDPLKFKKC
jgi:hypothetical protein